MCLTRKSSFFSILTLFETTNVSTRKCIRYVATQFICILAAWVKFQHSQVRALSSFFLPSHPSHILWESISLVVVILGLGGFRLDPQESGGLPGLDLLGLGHLGLPGLDRDSALA